MKKTLLIFAMIITVLITVSENYDARSVETLSYVIAIGLDKSESEEEELKLTIQIAKPDSSESGGTKIKSETASVECNSFNLGLAMLNLSNANQLNLSHCTVIIISEELAKEGIERFIDTLANNIEIRPTCNILISKESAEEFLSVTSEIEDISSKFYNSFVNSAKTISYTTPCQLSDFYSSLRDDVRAPRALYSFVHEDTIETLGLAAFKDYKMVGQLSGLDTLCYNILTNNFEEATIEVYNPQEPSIPLSVNLTHSEDTEIKVKFQNEIPKVTCNININAKILSGSKNYDYSTEESLRVIEAEIEKFLNQNIQNFLYKTSREYNSDIVGFEGFFRKNFLTQDELSKYDWNELYPKTEFDIKSQTYLKSGFLFSKN